MRLIELAIHGHEVADDQIIKTAKHRRPPYWLDKLSQIGLMIKVFSIFLWYTSCCLWSCSLQQQKIGI